MAKLNLWLLNRATSYDHAYLQEELAGDRVLTFGDKHTVKMGHRVAGHSGVNKGHISPVGMLMHEQPNLNEYFVPIPIKCLGAPRSLDEWLSAEGRARERAIRASYPEYFGHASRWQIYWATERARLEKIDPRRKVRMATKPGVGLYEVLRRTTKPGEKNVLIGYSQGGLVARYLGFIDEYLAKDPVIAGVITVQAPNYGSPLARAENADSVPTGIFQAGAALARLPPPSVGGGFKSLASFIADDLVGQGHFGLQRVLALLDAAIGDWEALNEYAQEERAGLFEFLTTAKKWLSGLEGNAMLAFPDMHIDRIGRAGSVLDSVVHHPPKKHAYGAVVGANVQLTDFVDSMVSKWWLQLAFNLSHDNLRPILVDGQRVYQQVVMQESAGLTDATAKLMANRYKKGIAQGSGPYARYRLNRAIPPRSHDFVIPSVYQLAPAPAGGGDHFLGNYVNDDAAHISGADNKHPQGARENQRLLGRMLARISQRLD